MFMGQLFRIHKRLPESLKRQVSVKVCRSFCSTYEHNKIDTDELAVDKRAKQDASLTPVWKKEAEQFMLTLDEEALKAKNEIETLIELLKQEDKDVPNVISPWDWKILITECRGYCSRVRYLQYLCEKKRKILSLKQQKDLERLEIFELSEKKEKAFVDRTDRLKRRKWWKGLESLKSDIPVVVDLDFETNIRHQRVVYEQMRSMWNFNLYHLQPLDLHFTSVHKNYRMKAIHEGDDKMYRLLNLNGKHFSEMFPLKDLVYLTPEGPPLLEFDRSCVYVLGGLEDTTPLISVSVARKFGIRYARFPITTYYKLAPNAFTSLNLSVAYRILLDMYLNDSWVQALSNNLPLGLYTLKKKFSRQEDMEEKTYTLQNDMGMPVPDTLRRKKRIPVSDKILSILNQK